MWLMFAVGSALFAGLTSILAKCGIRKTDSTVATAIRTGVVLVMSWVMVFVAGKQPALKAIPKRELGFIYLSGLATGGAGCAISGPFSWGTSTRWCPSTSPAPC